jgi:hypothetical protein
VPSGGAFQVASVLTGDRSGQVTFELSGAATVKATSCTRTSATRVTCATPSNGQTVRFTLTPTNPLARTPVTVHATAAAGLVELDDRDNSATTALAPDVAISALTQVSSTLLSTVVRVQVIGVPTGVSTVRLHLSGPDVGLTGLRFTAGADGADGEGDVDCYTSSATGGPLTDGADATCTGVQSGRNGSFHVDTRVARLPMTSTDATFTVVPVGVDQGSHGANDSRTITVRW